MPTYCYTTDDGEVVERHFPIAKRRKSITLPDGRRAIRDLSAEGRSRRYSVSAWPVLLGGTIGGDNRLKRERETLSRQKGVPTEFVQTRDGLKAKFTCQTHLNDFCRAFGVGDHDAGYRGVQPPNKTAEYLAAEKEALDRLEALRYGDGEEVD